MLHIGKLSKINFQQVVIDLSTEQNICQFCCIHNVLTNAIYNEAYYRLIEVCLSDRGIILS